MRKLLLSVFMCITAFAATAENIEDFVNEMSKNDKAEIITIKGNRILTNDSVLTVSDNRELEKLKDMGIESMEVLKFKINKEQQDLYTNRLKDLEETNGYVKMMQINDKNSNIFIYFKSNEEIINVIYVVDNQKKEFSVVKIVGEIKKDDAKKFIPNV